MINHEEQNTTNEQNEQEQQGAAGADNSENTGHDTSASSGGHKQDPEHNAGNDRMRIDEEGAEVKPGDQV